MTQPIADRATIRTAAVEDTAVVIAVVLDAGLRSREAGMSSVANDAPPVLAEVKAQIRSSRVWVAK